MRIALHACALTVLTAVPDGEAASAPVCAYLGATENFNEIAYCVSSVLPSSGSNTYGPENLFDGSAATAWCEGARGSGAGQTISLRIDNGGPFRRIFIENGYQKNRDIFERNARPRTIEVTTDTGLKFRHVLEDSDGENMFDLPEPGEYRAVDIRVLDVYPGSRYEDMCISTLLVDFDYEKYLEYEGKAGQQDDEDVEQNDTPRIPAEPVPQAEPLPDLPKL
ncbi:MAG: hypothetical protein KDJ77_06435 [Rhodobiaceae bacterium]|nr:hypothetical protein [Rhodobiaceae bacterium]